MDDETKEVDFASMYLSDKVQKGLLENGYSRPSPIQLKAIPLGRLGLDIIAQAKSGTGKTLVFAVIALEMVDVRVAEPQCLILAPTREIAIQSAKVINDVGMFFEPLNCRVFIGGVIDKNDAKQARTCNIAVGTPGRVCQLIQTDKLETAKIRLLVLDEADQMGAEGNNMHVQCNEIFRALPTRKQTCTFSATYNGPVMQSIRLYMRNPSFVSVVDQQKTALRGVREYYREVQPAASAALTLEGKKGQLLRILGQIPFYQCIVFCNEMAEGEDIAKELSAHGFPARFICGRQGQLDRNATMEAFHALSVRILVSTDLTARGIDMSKVNVVVNLDVPFDQSTYTHRTGRTGRFGTRGVCVNLLTRRELDRLNAFRASSGAGVEMQELPAKMDAEALRYHQELQATLPQRDQENFARFEAEVEHRKRTLDTSDGAGGGTSKRMRVRGSGDDKRGDLEVTAEGELDPGEWAAEDEEEEEEEEGEEGLEDYAEEDEADETEAEAEEHGAISTVSFVQEGDGVDPSHWVQHDSAAAEWDPWHVQQVQLLHQSICEYYAAHYYRCYCDAVAAMGPTHVPATGFRFRNYAQELKAQEPSGS